MIKCNQSFTWVLKKANKQEALVECLHVRELRELMESEDTTTFQILRVWPTVSSASDILKVSGHMAIESGETPKTLASSGLPVLTRVHPE
eukprot:1363925-Prymnesium_polylepis.1